MEKTASYLIAVAIKDAVRAVVPDPKNSTDPNAQAAYQIARLIRNAFAHAPFSPTWSIDPDCRDKTFAIPDLISLNTTGLDGTAFDWRHYGGPLAFFRLGRFVRFEILGDDLGPRKVIPMPSTSVVWRGSTKAAVSPDAVSVEGSRRPDGGIDLGGGHVIYPTE